MRGARTTTYTLIAALLIATGALVSVGCGGDTPSSKGTGVLAGLKPFVSATKILKQTPGTETTAGDITQTRGLVVSYQTEASDPRASGTLEVTVNADSALDGSATMWGTSVMTNEKGTWVCDGWTGALDASGHRFTFIEATGTGEYEGLTLYTLEYFASGPTTMLPPSQGMAGSGWIQESE
jgi:hypothetical protein